MKQIIKINGKVTEPLEGASLVEVEPGVYWVSANGVSYEARVSVEEILIEGHRFEFAIEDPRAWKGAGAGAGSEGKAQIKSPMPGKIVRILVARGDEVAAGQGVIVVEAMKMQNEMKSPIAGRVTSIDVKDGDSVNAGTVLASIEASAETSGEAAAG